MSTRKRDVQQHATTSRPRRRAQLRTALAPSWPSRPRVAGPTPPHAGSMLRRPHPVVLSLFSFLGAAIYGMHAWPRLDDTCRPLSLASNEDRPCPAAATGVEPGTVHIFAM